MLFKAPRTPVQHGTPPVRAVSRSVVFLSFSSGLRNSKPAELQVPRSLRARLVQVLDEAAKGVVRDELLALELDARRGRGVVDLEPLLDGAVRSYVWPSTC